MANKLTLRQLRQKYKTIDKRIDEIDEEIDMLDGVMYAFRNDPASRKKTISTAWVDELEERMIDIENEKAVLTKAWDRILNEIEEKNGL